MKWIWDKKNWPTFFYDETALKEWDQTLLLESGTIYGLSQHLSENSRTSLCIELLCTEAYKTSQIEGETLNRDSIQSSIAKQLGLFQTAEAIPPREKGISELMIDNYQNLTKRLTHKMLYRWHQTLFQEQNITPIGNYRTSKTPMQIISGHLHKPTVHYQAPPSVQVHDEMKQYIHWFNTEALSLSPLAKAGMAHLYFELIHPFEDGNGRIGRALAEKALAQSIGKPALFSLSTAIQKNQKAYYQALEAAGKTLDITDWLLFFSKIILSGIQETQELITFTLKKKDILEKKDLNNRQIKGLLRLFQEGPNGFKGGLSRKNYCTITQASSPTATRDLTDLVNQKILRTEGSLKSTRYYLIL